jgi:hypothetical protein
MPRRWPVGAGASTFDAQVDAQWTVGGRPQRGYLLALLPGPQRRGEGLGALRRRHAARPGEPALVTDALLTATFTFHPSGPVPTLELTVYVRAVPAPGPLRVRQRSRLVGGPRPNSERPPTASRGPTARHQCSVGLVDEVCDIWDSRDRLVAQATQLATVRFTTAAR